MSIKFGPAGIGPVKEALINLEKYSGNGLEACEIAFTYGVYIKKEEDIKTIREASEKLGIKLSIHAPYWINLNSKEKEKIEKSKERILSCCEVGEKIGAYRVVFHPGFYSGTKISSKKSWISQNSKTKQEFQEMDKEEAYENIKNAVLDIQEEIKKNKWKIQIAPECMGKVNVFGSVEEIARLVSDTGCSFCIDFAHVLAREKRVDYRKIKKLFSKEKDWHLHFSGIEYGEKGEKRHIKTTREGWNKLLENLPKDKNIIIINESPTPFMDAVLGLEVMKK